MLDRLTRPVDKHRKNSSDKTTSSSDSKQLGMYESLTVRGTVAEDTLQ
jgi:hypothetical protein